jgi:hypothetical protein
MATSTIRRTTWGGPFASAIAGLSLGSLALLALFGPAAVQLVNRDDPASGARPVAVVAGGLLVLLAASTAPTVARSWLIGGRATRVRPLGASVVFLVGVVVFAVAVPLAVVASDPAAAAMALSGVLGCTTVATVLFGVASLPLVDS